MFAKPGAYDVIMRYSSLTPKLVPDNVPAPRGIGMKIFGIEGEKIWGEDKKTQDWTFNNYPILELRDSKTTMEIADSLERNFNDIPKFAEELANRPDADVACWPNKIPRQHSKLELFLFRSNGWIFFSFLFVGLSQPYSGRHARIFTIGIPVRRQCGQIRRLPER